MADIAMGLLTAIQVVHPPNAMNIILHAKSETLMEVATHFAEGAQVAKILHTTAVALELGEVMMTNTGSGAINIIELDEIMGTDLICLHAASITNLPLECLYRL